MKITGQQGTPPSSTALTNPTEVGGDLDGTIPDNATVVGIGGIPITGVPASGDGLVFDGTNWTYAPGGGSGLPWFNVQTYGAVGDATTDDTAAINLAIAALIAAGQGVLYFPAATAYLCTSALTTISVPCTVLGDGGAGDPIYSSPVSQVRQSSATANLFTVSATGVAFQNISLRNTNAGTPSAGCGIEFLNPAGGSWARMENITVSRFRDNISVADGLAWTLTNAFIYDPVRYGLRIQGLTGTDNGDQSVVGCYFMADSRAGTAAIRFESAGGLKITNTKINNRTSSFVTGIDLTPAASSSLLQLTNVSIENISGDAVKVTTSGFQWDHLTFVGCQFNLVSNTTGSAIKITAANLGEINQVVISGCSFDQSGGGAAAAINLTKVNDAVIGNNVLRGYGSLLATSGCTNILDASGGVAAGVAVTGTPSVGQSPVATSSTTATWQAPDIEDAGHYELLMAGGITSPPEPLENGDGSDWLYAWVPA